MLRIAVVSTNFPSSGLPTNGRAAYQTLRVLSQSCELQVFYPHATYPSFFRPPSRIYENLDASYSTPDVRVSYLNYSALPLLSRPFNGLFASRVLLPHVRSFAPDVLLGYFLYPEGFAALQIAKTLSIPAVVRSMGSDINRIRDPLTSIYTRGVIQKADFVVTVSEDLRRKAISMGAAPERSRSLLNGCDTAVFHVKDRLAARATLGIDPSVEAVVYVGRMDTKKGLRELVQAASLLHRDRPKLHVYMIGEGPDRAIIEQQIKAAGTHAFVHTKPGCSFDEVATWMTAADLVTLPSYMEGCPNVVLEALACGRPVVATTVGGIPEILREECGCLVPPRDAAALAKGLSSVLGRSWDAKAIAAQSGRSWKDVANELLTIFDLVLSRRPGSESRHPQNV